MGAATAATLAPGDIVTLHGELGTGKTTLVRGAARALGVRGHVTSPTFTVAQRYDGDVPVAHLDAYRLDAVDDEELGLALETAAGAVAFVEWPDALGPGFGTPAVVVTLTHAGGDNRELTLDCADPAREALIRSTLDDAGA